MNEYEYLEKQNIIKREGLSFSAISCNNIKNCLTFGDAFEMTDLNIEDSLKERCETQFLSKFHYMQFYIQVKFVSAC